MSEFEYPPRMGWCTKHSSTTVCKDCEIDRLKAELEYTKEMSNAFMDERNNLRIQLSEARAEVDRYKAGVEVEGLFDVQYGLNLCSSETHKLDNSVRYGKVRVLIMKLEG